MTRGWWNMACWNGLSHEQQRRLIEVGNLPIDYRPEGECQNPASVCVETHADEAEGPRFYCRPCAVAFLVGATVQPQPEDECECGHQRSQHIYHQGACRPGFRCQNGCIGFHARAS